MPDDVPVSIARRLRWYGGTATLSLLVAVAGLQLVVVSPSFPFVHARADFRVPFLYHSDALLILPFVKETVETGSHWKTERLGAPGVQELHDFPVIDHLHFAIIRVLALFLHDPVVVFNLYHLLTYPAVAVAMMAVLRHFGLSFPASAAGGIIYTFLPYHAQRGESHYFLAAYWLVPVTTALILEIARGRLPFFRRDGESWRTEWRGKAAIAAVTISALTALAGAYYAFFACALFVPAAIMGCVRVNTWRPAAAAGACVAAIGFIGTLQHLPTFWYHREFGPNTNPTERYPEESEIYGLKITHLVLPVNGHNLRPLAWLKGKYNSAFRPHQNENETTTLGAVGTAGLVGLCAVALFGRRRDWPYGPLATLTVFILVLSVAGGFGSVFNQLVTPQVRCYNRIVVYLAVLTTFAVCQSVDRWFDTRTGRTGRYRPVAFFALGAVAIWDQSGCDWFRSHSWKESDVVVSRREYGLDRAFFSRVEAVLPEGSVFTFPYIPFPESQPVYDLGSYSHVRGYLHTKKLRWSFGAMRGREADNWARQASLEPPEAMIRRLAYRGFDGLFVDKRGFDPERADAVVEGLRRVLGSTTDAASAPIEHGDGQQLFFDLRSYRSWLVSQLGGDGYTRAAKAEEEQVTVLWLKGFPVVELPGREDKIRKCGPKGTLMLVNPADRPRRVRLSTIIRTDHEPMARVEIDGGTVWSDRLEVNNRSGRYETEFVLPPGRHQVLFRCTPHATFTPSDHRALFVALIQFQLTALD
jgi:hypothetical protein